MSYKLEGEATSLADIDRDMAKLKALRAAAIAERDALKQVPRAVPKGGVDFNELLSWDSLYAFAAAEGCGKATATKLKIALSNIRGGWHDSGLYMGDLCHMELWTCRNFENPHKPGIENRSNVGRQTVRLFRAWRAYLNVTDVRTPEGWNRPA